MFEVRAAEPAEVEDDLPPERVGVDEFAALASLDALADGDGGPLTDAQVLDVVAGWAAVEARAAAAKRAWAAALGRRQSMLPDWRQARRRVSVPSVAGDEVAIRCGVSRLMAARWIAEGEMYAPSGSLAQVGVAMQAGLIDAGKGREFVDALGEGDPLVAVAVCEQVVPLAPSLTQRQLAATIQTAVVAADSAGASARHERAARQRRVERVRVLPDGMARLSAVLTAAQAASVYAACEAAAKAAKAAGDDRTLEQLRADSLGAMGAHALAAGRIGPVEVLDGDDPGEQGGVGGQIGPAGSSSAATPTESAAPTRSESEGRQTGWRERPPPPAESFRFSGPTGAVELTIPLPILDGHDPAGAVQALLAELGSNREVTREVDDGLPGVNDLGRGPDGDVGQVGVEDDDVGRARGGNMGRGADGAVGRAGVEDDADGDVGRVGRVADGDVGQPGVEDDDGDVGRVAKDDVGRGAEDDVGQAVDDDVGGAVEDDVAGVEVRADVAGPAQPGRVSPGHAGRSVPWPGEARLGEVLVPMLSGYGAVDPATARALVADGGVRVFVTDACTEAWRRATSAPGAVTEWDAGRDVYEPPAPLARFVRQRDATCVAPGCTVLSVSCDIDHVIEFPLGPTDAWNLRPQCRRHHLLKTHAGHRLAIEPDGSLTWTTPTGQTLHRPLGGTWTRRERRLAPPSLAELRCPRAA